MKPWAKDFYCSQAWKSTREAYKSSVGGLCELCWSKKIVKPGEIVHHKVPLTPENISDPQITLSFDNLCLVCRDHHAQLHDRRQRRYKVDDQGRVIFL